MSSSRPPGPLALAAAIAEAQGAGLLGVPFVRSGRGWFRDLPPPSATPPESVFGPVWTLLYTLTAVSTWLVARAPAGPDRTAALRLHQVQLALNAAWTPLFFGARRPRIALAELAALLAVVVVLARRALRTSTAAGLLLLPYLVWLAFAATLNARLVFRQAHD